MTSKGPHWGSNRRVYNSSVCSTKIRKLWNNTNFHYLRPSNQIYSLSIYSPIFIRCNYNKFNLPTSNTPKITNCIFLIQPYSPSYCIYYNSNPMKLHRSHYINNRTRINFIIIILSSKFKLRTYPQPNHNLARGLQIIFPLIATSWLIASLANLALPPSINLIGELFITISLFSWSNFSIILIGINIIITGIYSIYIIITTQRGKLTNHINNLQPSHTRELTLISLHIIPLNLLTISPKLITGLTIFKYSLKKTLDYESKNKN